LKATVPATDDVQVMVHFPSDVALTTQDMAGFPAPASYVPLQVHKAGPIWLGRLQQEGGVDEEEEQATSTKPVATNSGAITFHVRIANLHRPIIRPPGPARAPIAIRVSVACRWKQTQLHAELARAAAAELRRRSPSWARTGARHDRDRTTDQAGRH
jgi:hypothetical protein